jgi:hypothetical protein
MSARIVEVFAARPEDIEDDGLSEAMGSGATRKFRILSTAKMQSNPAAPFGKPE